MIIIEKSFKNYSNIILNKFIKSSFNKKKINSFLNKILKGKLLSKLLNKLKISLMIDIDIK
jgi:hypothetical protein